MQVIEKTHINHSALYRLALLVFPEVMQTLSEETRRCVQYAIRNGYDLSEIKTAISLGVGTRSDQIEIQYQVATPHGWINNGTVETIPETSWNLTKTQNLNILALKELRDELVKIGEQSATSPEPITGRRHYQNLTNAPVQDGVAKTPRRDEEF